MISLPVLSGLLNVQQVAAWGWYTKFVPERSVGFEFKLFPSATRGYSCFVCCFECKVLMSRSLVLVVLNCESGTWSWSGAGVQKQVCRCVYGSYVARETLWNASFWKLRFVMYFETHLSQYFARRCQKFIACYSSDIKCGSKFPRESRDEMARCYKENTFLHPSVDRKCACPIVVSAIVYRLCWRHSDANFYLFIYLFIYLSVYLLATCPSCCYTETL